MFVRGIAEELLALHLPSFRKMSLFEACQGPALAPVDVSVLPCDVKASTTVLSGVGLFRSNCCVLTSLPHPSTRQKTLSLWLSREHTNVATLKSPGCGDSTPRQSRKYWALRSMGCRCHAVYAVHKRREDGMCYLSPSHLLVVHIDA